MELADVRCLAVLGLRRTGRPAALLARRELPAARVVALDEGTPPDDDTVEVLAAAGIEVLTGPAAVLPGDAGLLVKSPGVPDTSAAVQEALRRGVPVWSEVEFAGRFLANPVVGITGTNGKTTTTELTGAVFRDARPAGRRRRQHRPRPGRHARRDPAGRDGGGRALQLPARAHRAVPAGRGRPPQPRGGPPRPARHLPRLRGREAAHLREPDAGRRGAAVRRRRRHPRGAGRRAAGRPGPARLVLRPAGEGRRAGRRGAHRRPRRRRRAVGAGARRAAPSLPPRRAGAARRPQPAELARRRGGRLHRRRAGLGGRGDAAHASRASRTACRSGTSSPA